MTGQRLPERYLSPSVRDYIEQAYYARVNQQAKLEILIQDPNFLESTGTNPALFSDHGVVHVRDVARQILRVLHVINGVLIPYRTEQHLESFLYGYGVALAYLHDIGMSDLSPFGRAMHPEFAAQSVFDGSLDAVIATMWQDNCGNVPRHLTQLSQANVLKRDPQIVYRELLAMSVGHSKSKTPASVLDDSNALCTHMQKTIGGNLKFLFSQQQQAKGKSLPADFTFEETAPSYLGKFYADFQREAFDWLTDTSESGRQLVADVTDTLRALRCADAFRQRGTVEKTSGGYEVYTSQKTGNCIIALRLGDNRLFLMELLNNPDGAGEANISSSEYDYEGNLRISFHRGAFENQAAQDRSVYSTAYVVSDLLQDTIGSFCRAAPPPGIKTSADIQVFLESTDDDPRFAALVRDELVQANPKLQHQIHVVPSLRYVGESERALYLHAHDLHWDAAERQSMLDKIKAAGQKLTNFDPVEGFRRVKIIVVQAGEKLIEAGAPPSFVYLPLDEGLKILPMGGYQSFSVEAWMPLGTTGVIRGDIRNADVVAEKNVTVLIIPKEVYLKTWYNPYSPSELQEILLKNDELDP